MSPPSSLSIALRDGLRLGPTELRVRAIAELVLPSGRVIACDPLTSRPLSPFAASLPCGRFPVLVTDLVRDGASLGDNLFASVRFSPGEPVRWENARTEGATAEGDEGYPVDAGNGCFCDESAASIFDDGALLDRLEAAQCDELRGGEVLVDARTGANLVFFSSGAGDGVYASYLGYDAGGEVVALVTDFRLDAAAMFARGGPWDAGEDPASHLVELDEFLAAYGPPSPAWVAERLPGASLQAAWDACPHGTMMAFMLRRLDHPARRDVLLWDLDDAAALFRRFKVGAPAMGIAALRARVAAGELALDAADEERDDWMIRGRRALDQRFPRPEPTAAILAKLEGRALADANAPVREAVAARDRALAAAIRRLVPDAPTLEALADSWARRE